MLKMKPKCEQCEQKLGHVDEAYICSFECTFCGDCTTALEHVCPNCSGELVKRPTRTRSPVKVAADQIKRKLTGSKPA